MTNGCVIKNATLALRMRGADIIHPRSKRKNTLEATIDLKRNGPRDEPEPCAHALCHRLWFLWKPKNQWHVLGLL
uniref:Uncharacterized protein n=1 Tax=Knipowitschia caucasica TaxID=637954 RepID=A0AAV2MSJ1_KNICA